MIQYSYRVRVDYRTQSGDWSVVSPISASSPGEARTIAVANVRQGGWIGEVLGAAVVGGSPHVGRPDSTMIVID